MKKKTYRETERNDSRRQAYIPCIKNHQKSENREQAKERLAYVETRIGMKTRVDRIFSLEDETEAFIKCEEHFDELENPQVKAKGKGKGTTKGTTKNTDPEHHVSHGVMFMYKDHLEKSRKWFKQINGLN